MTPEQLRASILQFAVQGKLVEQRTEEGTAEELYQIIKTKAKELPSITEEEKSFDIPDSWKWVKLGDVLKISTGKRDANHGTKNGKYDFYTCSSEPIKADTYSFDGECLIAPGNGANVGLVIYHNGKFEAYQRTYVLERFSEESYMMYFKYAMEWNWKRYNADKMFGSATPYIKLGNLQNYCFPLPPLEEQHRIVAKIEELLPYVDRYAEAYEKLEQFNAKFPEDMKKSILQYAIQGKLVEQRPEEGTGEELYQQIQAEKQKLIKEGKIKKEKPLAEIAEDEIPFDIPDSWKWVRLGSVIREVIVPQRDKPSFSSEGIPWCRIEDREGNLLNGSKSNQLVSDETIKKMNLKVLPIGSVLSACTGGSIGTIVINTVECCTNQTFNALVPSSGVYNWFLFYYLTTKFNELRRVGTGTTMPYISQQKSKEMVFPLPPLEEQHRIVAKIEELLPYCNRLIK